MTSQSTVISERARESLITKGMLGHALNYFEAMQLCHDGYPVKVRGSMGWYLKSEFRDLSCSMWKDKRYALWVMSADNEYQKEFVTESQHIFIEWELKL